MSVKNRNSIVTDGLVFYVDAGNVESYPGSGTTWTDFIGNGNSSMRNMTGAQNYSLDNGGCFSFDGGDESFDSSSTFIDPNSDFTFNSWSKYSSGTVNYTLVCNHQSTSSMTIRYLGSTIQIVDSYKTAVGAFSNFTSQADTWYNICVTRSSNTYSLYVDGVYKSNFTNSEVYNNSPNSIGRSRNNAYFNGKIASISFFDRALSASEITQNYNALKNRFI